MSTLPFLLSVADELDNINSQSYMDDFGLGFHPHRQYYRSPTIQLSLPASTDWMQERHRCRTHKFIDESQNNLQPTLEDDEDAAAMASAVDAICSNNAYAENYDDDRYGGGASTSAACRQKYSSALNSNNGDGSREDNIDNSVQLYNLSKKCCKNYYHHHAPHTSSSKQAKPCGETSYKLHTKCLEGNNSSSDESLQKVSSSIEFLTCFLVKKSRASKNPNTGSGDGKKS